ncbi:unannotated protein [freshwater metagenome]|uniref:Unannotated protein n=1 Tax=freshwater metagenome TaxID=449393 RepID=A0A6J6LH95_9ZZZZ
MPLAATRSSAKRPRPSGPFRRRPAQSRICWVGQCGQWIVTASSRVSSMTSALETLRRRRSPLRVSLPWFRRTRTTRKARSPQMRSTVELRRHSPTTPMAPFARSPMATASRCRRRSMSKIVWSTPRGRRHRGVSRAHGKSPLAATSPQNNSRRQPDRRPSLTFTIPMVGCPKQPLPPDWSRRRSPGHGPSMTPRID